MQGKPEGWRQGLGMYEEALQEAEAPGQLVPGYLAQMLPWLYSVLVLVYLFHTLMQPCPVPELGISKASMVSKYGKPTFDYDESRSNIVFTVSLSGFKLGREPKKGNSYSVYVGGWLGRQCSVVVFGPDNTTIDVVRGGT